MKSFFRDGGPALWLAILFLAVVSVAIMAPWALTPYDPFATNTSALFEAPSLAHPLGTDQVGRDVLSRIIFGSSTSVIVGLGATVIALAVGTGLGTFSAVLSRTSTFAVGRSVEVLLALPEFLLALFIVALIGPGPVSIFVALAIAAIPAYVNVSRASARMARNGESVRTATVMGISPGRVFFRYIAAEAVQPSIALFPLGVSFAILTAASLSFLGLGVQAPTPDWGLMLAEARDYLARAWWLVISPGVALSLTVASFAVVGRAIQRALR